MRNYITSYDPFFNSFFVDKKRNNAQMMSTDIKETKEEYVMKINLPEVNKEDIKVELKNGYLTIKAALLREEDEDGEYIFREREYGEYSRSYYLGDNVALEDIHAKLNNGVLVLNIKKNEKKPEEHLVEIE